MSCILAGSRVSNRVGWSSMARELQDSGGRRWETFMVVGAVVAFLVIFGLFLSMFSGSPRSLEEPEWCQDTDSGKELLSEGHAPVL